MIRDDKDCKHPVRFLKLSVIVIGKLVSLFFLVVPRRTRPHTRLVTGELQTEVQSRERYRQSREPPPPEGSTSYCCTTDTSRLTNCNLFKVTVSRPDSTSTMTCKTVRKVFPCTALRGGGSRVSKNLLTTSVLCSSYIFTVTINVYDRCQPLISIYSLW